MKIICAIFFSVLALSACSATGAPYRQPVATRDSATVVVYRTAGMVQRVFSVDIDGKPVCDLHNGGFFISHQTGNVTVSSSLWDMPGTSRLSLLTQRGKIYYVNIEMSGKRYAGLLGLPGLLVAEGVSDKGGPFDIEGVSNPDLSELREDCSAI